MHHYPWMSWVCNTAVTCLSVSPVLHSTDMGLTRVPHICVPGNTGLCCPPDTLEVLATPQYLEYRTLSHSSMLHSSVTCLTKFDFLLYIAFLPARTLRGPCSPQPVWYSPLPKWPIRYRGTSQSKCLLLLSLQLSVTFHVLVNLSVKWGEHISRTLHKNSALLQSCTQGCPFPGGASGPFPNHSS